MVSYLHCFPSAFSYFAMLTTFSLKDVFLWLLSGWCLKWEHSGVSSSISTQWWFWQRWPETNKVGGLCIPTTKTEEWKVLTLISLENIVKNLSCSLYITLERKGFSDFKTFFSLLFCLLFRPQGKEYSTAVKWYSQAFFIVTMYSGIVYECTVFMHCMYIYSWTVRRIKVDFANSHRELVFAFYIEYDVGKFILDFCLMCQLCCHKNATLILLHGCFTKSFIIMKLITWEFYINNVTRQIGMFLKLIDTFQ